MKEINKENQEKMEFLLKFHEKQKETNKE